MRQNVPLDSQPRLVRNVKVVDVVNVPLKVHPEVHRLLVVLLELLNVLEDKLTVVVKLKAPQGELESGLVTGLLGLLVRLVTVLVGLVRVLGLGFPAHLRVKVLFVKDVLERLVEGILILLVEAILLPDLHHLAHTLEVHGAAAHGARGLVALEVPGLDAVATEAVTAHELAGCVAAVTDRALTRHF